MMFEPRVALASLSGESDAAWARAGEEFIGAAFLGGIAIDDPAREAARAMVRDRDRDEFLPDDPRTFIDRELSLLDDVSLQPGVNIRSTTVDPVREIAAVCATHGAILEVNAHCRQAELCAVGCGETLLADTARLCEFVRATSDHEVSVSVKVRAEVEGVSLPETARRIETAGADAIHIDAMDTESVISDVADATDDLFIIANNGVRDRSTTREYLEYGADAVSVGRPSDRPAVLERVRAAVNTWFQEQEATV